jgi:hypothetical protein
VFVRAHRFGASALAFAPWQALLAASHRSVSDRRRRLDRRQHPNRDGGSVNSVRPSRKIKIDRNRRAGPA